MIGSYCSSIHSNVILPTVTNSSVILGARVLSAIPALEIAYCALQDLVSLSKIITFKWTNQNNELSEDEYSQQSMIKQKQAKLLKEFTQHAFVAVALGISALNLFTGSAVLGTIGFAVYAKRSWINEITSTNKSLAVLITGLGLEALKLVTKSILKKSGKFAIVKTFGALKAVISKIRTIAGSIIRGIKQVSLNPLKIVGKLFKLLGNVVQVGGGVIGKIVSIAIKIIASLIRHPIIGAAVLGVTACLLGALMVPGTTGVIIGSLFFVVKTAILVTKTTLYLIPTILISSTKVIGTALYFAPTVIKHVGQKLASVLTYAIPASANLLLGSVKVISSGLTFAPSILVAAGQTTASVVAGTLRIIPTVLSTIGSVAKFILRF